MVQVAYITYILSLSSGCYYSVTQKMITGKTYISILYAIDFHIKVDRKQILSKQGSKIKS